MVGDPIAHSLSPVLHRAGYAALGLDRVLLTCDEDNPGSRMVIEKAGGVLEDVRVGKRRYWVPTAR